MRKIPKGIAVIKWDDKEGVLLKSKYPEDLKIGESEIMRIYTSHAMGEGRPGLLSIRLSGVDNVLSYFTGIDVETQFAIAILLNVDEDSSWFEEPLLESVNNILSNVETARFEEILLKSFNYIIKSSILTREQILAHIFKDYRLNKLLEILTEGPIAISELRNRLETEFGESISNMDKLLSYFVRSNLIIRDFVKGEKEEFIFLIQDLYESRSPPYNILSKIKSKKISALLEDEYKNNLISYFKSYTPTLKDNRRLAELLTNPNFYEIIIRLRQEPILSEDLLKYSNLEEDEINEIIQNLKVMKIIGEFNDPKLNKWTLLTSDIKFETFFPSYLLENIRKLSKSRKVKSDVIIKHIELLEKNYS